MADNISANQPLAGQLASLQAPSFAARKIGQDFNPFNDTKPAFAGGFNQAQIPGTGNALNLMA